MKKVFLFAAAAAALAACSDEELSTQSQVLTSNEAPVNFSVYTERGLTRGGGQAGDLTNENIGANGFGVFAYYTAGEQYDAKATPNFMYNQQITCTGTATAGTLWSYEPVKYWPNEYGDKAISDETDYLTFFAYAPWTEVEPTTGNIVPKTSDQGSTTIAETAEHQQKYNIVSVNKNTATGDPMVKYVVDTDPKTSVDLLWGVAAETAGDNYSPIDERNNNVSVKPGFPFLSLVKPNNPQSDRLQFNLKHALAKLKVTIDYIADDFTPNGQSKDIDPRKTRIYVRSFKMGGFATKGALNLNNTTAGQPLWKDFDGSKDLAFDDVTFQDGRKDGKEGETNGAQSNETPQGLNPNIVENYAQTTNGVFGADKTIGVTKDAQLLFGGDASANNGGYFYVIPRNEDGNTVSVTIAYDVETIDPALAGKLSDNETHGISIENIISKENIFAGIDFKAGYQYEVNIHLGMTSVKVEATVTEWKDNGKTNVDLPDNQQMAAVTAANFTYSDYQYKGKLYASDNDVVYVPLNATPDEDMMNDLARFLGALHRAAGVAKITYDSKDYTWDPTRVYDLGLVSDPNAKELKGSNWINAEGQTLVSVITAQATALQSAGKLKLTADGAEVVIYLAKPTHSFESFGFQQGNYVAWGSGKVYANDDLVKEINGVSYKKIVVLENSEPSFIGKVYYIAASATADDGATKYPLFDQFGNGVGIYVEITAIN